jgi:hypothetical protein
VGQCGGIEAALTRELTGAERASENRDSHRSRAVNTASRRLASGGPIAANPSSVQLTPKMSAWAYDWRSSRSNCAANGSIAGSVPRSAINETIAFPS